MDALILAANPGSASRKYALYKKNELLVSLHFEFEGGQIICTVVTKNKVTKLQPEIDRLEDASAQVVPIIEKAGDIQNVNISGIGLRVVAPTSYFLQDRLLDDEAHDRLKALKAKVPLHIGATLQEAEHLKKYFPDCPVLLISDSAFHITKPDYAWNYGVHLEDSDRLEIKRFGYHGISLASVVRNLAIQDKLPEKLIVCHLGSGSSTTAIQNGQSVDTTMGYSPLEGLMMATRSGPMDIVAALTLKKDLGLNDEAFENYLNTSSGLRGISGASSDIRELINFEAAGDYRAGLALRMFVYHIQQSIGSLAATMDGVDAIVFTGTVGERSFIIRKRILDKLLFLGFALDEGINAKTIEPRELARISPRTRQKPIYVLATDESKEIAMRVSQHTNN